MHIKVFEFPAIPGNPRNYPSAGSVAMLPLVWQNGFQTAEIILCEGAATGASRSGNTGVSASASCGRIVPGRPGWPMENMPMRRIVGDMLNLPTGEVIVINGAQTAYQGWGKAGNPAFNPVKYIGNAAPGKRFQVLAGTAVARLYHSTGNLLPDGRVLVAGSNTHQF